MDQFKTFNISEIEMYSIVMPLYVSANAADNV